jgi:Holliday junction resolvase RusA-like endonuclease
MTEFSLTVPSIPVSVNHYKEPKIIKPRGSKYHTIIWIETPEAQLYKLQVRQAAKFRSLAPATQRERDRVRYELDVKVILGPGQRGDGDNFWKVIADGLVQCGAIHSDARVKRWIMDVDDEQREQNNPRTEITVRVIGKSLTTEDTKEHKGKINGQV